MATLDPEKKKTITEGLARLFATAMVMKQNLFAYAWNVVDPRFQELHKLFRKGGFGLMPHVNALAKRIRALDKIVPAAPAEYLPISFITDHPGLTDGNLMLQSLLADGQTFSRALKEMLDRLDSFKDQTTAQIVASLDVCLNTFAWKVKAYLTIQPQGWEKSPGFEHITVQNSPSTVGIAGQGLAQYLVGLEKKGATQQKRGERLAGFSEGQKA